MGAGRAGRHGRQQGTRGAQADVRGRAGRHGAGRADDRRAIGRRAGGRLVGGRRSGGRPGVRDRQALGVRLALGCALGALGLFLDPIRLGIFPESQNEHCSL